MSISITTTPGIITPAYNPMYYNVYNVNYTLDGFAWTEDMSIIGSKLPKPSTPDNDYTTASLGSYIKAPTNTYNQWWDPSRIAQTFLGYNFLPDITCLTASGEECVGVLSNTLSYQTTATDKSANDKTVSTYVFNGGDDRNAFRNFETSTVGTVQVTKPYNYIPNINYTSQSRFLTHFNTRTVDLNETGTLSCLNAVFSATTAEGSNVSITASTDSFDITTYNNGNVVNRWMIENPIRNHKAYDNTYTWNTSKNRVTIPAYPKNLNTNAPWSFYDNYFVAGSFGMISLYPHNLEVGDTIYVVQDPGFLFSAYNGQHTVLTIVSDYIVGTSTPWSGSSPTNGGSAIKVVGDGCGLSLIDDTQLQYTAVTNNAGFAEFNFTSDVSNVKPNAWIFTSGSTVYPTNGFGTTQAKVSYTTPNKLLSNLPYVSNDTGFALVRQRIPSSTQQIFNDVDKYKIQFSHYTGSTNAFTAYGDGSTFDIKCKCSKHDWIELIWLNKLGAFDSMLFNGRNTKSIEFNKETMTKRLGDQKYSPYTYEVIGYTTQDFEKQNFNGYQDTSYTVSTGWISESEGDRVIECMGSNVVYMAEDGIYTPVVATIENVDVKTRQNQKLIYYTISLDLTYNTLSQRL